MLHTCEVRALRHQDELFQFVLVPGLPADNNLAERSIRPLVPPALAATGDGVMRKISGGTRSPAGSKTRLTLASVFQTWAARNRNPFTECLTALQPLSPPPPCPQPSNPNGERLLRIWTRFRIVLGGCGSAHFDKKWAVRPCCGLLQSQTGRRHAPKHSRTWPGLSAIAAGIGERSPWDRQRCPQCGRRLTIKHWQLHAPGRGFSRAARGCGGCAMRVYAGTQSYAEPAALLVRGSWYSREVRRCAVDHSVHGRLSLRRSWLGRQERWRRWRPLDTPLPGAPCDLAASAVPRWLDCAGGVAPALVRPGNCRTLRSVKSGGPAGLWARLRGGATRGGARRLADSVTGLLWPPLVAEREAWAVPFARARLAGLDWPRLRGVTLVRAPRVSASLGARPELGCSSSGVSGAAGAPWRASWRTRPPRLRLAPWPQ